MRTSAGAYGALVVVMAMACAPVPPRPIGVLDSDADGRVSRAEFAAFMNREGFARIDADKNGSISRDEWRAFDTSLEAEENFEALDTNHDEAISPAEWTYNFGRSGVGLRLFSNLDLDRDEALSEPEIDRSPVAPMLSITF
jgi:Ca2+-binding EF-hand superfamily protein